MPGTFRGATWCTHLILSQHLPNLLFAGGGSPMGRRGPRRWRRRSRLVMRRWEWRRDARWRPTVLANIGQGISPRQVRVGGRGGGLRRHRWLLGGHHRWNLGATTVVGRGIGRAHRAIATRRSSQVWRHRGADHVGSRGVEHGRTTAIVCGHLSRRQRRARWINGHIGNGHMGEVRLSREVRVMRVLQRTDGVEMSLQLSLHTNDCLGGQFGGAG